MTPNANIAAHGYGSFAASAARSISAKSDTIAPRGRNHPGASGRTSRDFVPVPAKNRGWLDGVFSGGFSTTAQGPGCKLGCFAAGFEIAAAQELRIL